MKVYSFVQHIVSNSEDFGVRIECFTNEKEAQKFFNDIVKEEKEISKERHYFVETNKKDNFCAYLKGEFINEHTTNEIRVFEI